MSSLASRLSTVNPTYFVVACMLLNSADALFTYYYMTHGGSELNPAMAWVMKYGMGWFMALKLIGANALILFIGYHFSDSAMARVGLAVGTAAYSLLLMWHLYGMVL